MYIQITYKRYFLHILHLNILLAKKRKKKLMLWCFVLQKQTTTAFKLIHFNEIHREVDKYQSKSKNKQLHLG